MINENCLFLSIPIVHYLISLPDDVVTSHTDKILPPCHSSRHNQILLLINNPQLEGDICLHSLKLVYFVKDLILLHVPVFRCQTVSTFGWRMCSEPALFYQPQPHTDLSCPPLHTVTYKYVHILYCNICVYIFYQSLMFNKCPVSTNHVPYMI